MSSLLDPKIMMSIKGLSLSAKTTIEGLMNGINKSQLKGAGMEFAQYRSYQPGDDLRMLDWKMFARSDRYYIRESEIETNINIRLLVDGTASMNHSDGAFTKIDYARYLAASLAYLANLQGDAIALDILQTKEVISLPAKNNYQHLHRLFYQLEQLQPEGKFMSTGHIKRFYNGAGRRELVICITDLYEEEGEIFTLLCQLSSLRHEVIIFHLLSRNELELDFKGYSSFEDLETGAMIDTDTVAIKKAYLSNINSYLENIKLKAMEVGVFYRQLCTDEPLEQAIRDFLKQRKKLKI